MEFLWFFVIPTIYIFFRFHNTLVWFPCILETFILISETFFFFFHSRINTFLSDKLRRKVNRPSSCPHRLTRAKLDLQVQVCLSSPLCSCRYYLFSYSLHSVYFQHNFRLKFLVLAQMKIIVLYIERLYWVFLFLEVTSSQIFLPHWCV